MNQRIIASNLAELYRHAAERYDALPAFATRRNELDWVPVTFRELFERGLDLATGLIEMGVEAREHVGLFGDNRAEWIIADYGVQLCGAADVPRGSDVTDNELVQIVNHAGIRVAFVETEKLFRRLYALRQEMPALREIIMLDPNAKPQSGARLLVELCEAGARLRSEGDRRSEERIADISEDDLFTLIYTSGTTGEPKGVMLTHANMMSQIRTLPGNHTCYDRVVSILPVWHIFERVMEMYAISCGACTFYSSIRTLSRDMRNIEPTFMASAPRLWEKLHEGILKAVGESHPVRRVLFRIAYFLGRSYRESILHLKRKSLRLQPSSKLKSAALFAYNGLKWLLVVPWYGFFNAAVLERIRQNACGSLTETVSGGGALPEEIDKFFNYIGIPVLEGYGMTETSPVLAVRTMDELVIGTVGPPLADTEIRIVDLETGEVLYPNEKCPHDGRGKRGEIWVRGPQVMKGYYRQQKLTDSAIRDGWLRTGDLGMITFNGCLKILGRCKATIVLSSGENVEPELIEMRLQQSRYVNHCMLVGQDCKFLCALIFPVLEEFQAMGIEAGTLEELSRHPEAGKIIREEIRRTITASKGFKLYEIIYDFRLLPQPAEVGFELTNLFKIRRHIITQRYEALIREMFLRR